MLTSENLCGVGEDRRLQVLEAFRKYSMSAIMYEDRRWGVVVTRLVAAIELCCVVSRALLSMFLCIMSNRRKRKHL